MEKNFLVSCWSTELSRNTRRKLEDFLGISFFEYPANVELLISTSGSKIQSVCMFNNDNINHITVQEKLQLNIPGHITKIKLRLRAIFEKRGTLIRFNPNCVKVITKMNASEKQ